MVTNAVFGKGPKDKKKMGTGVYKQYGVGKDGFNISSIQFALHYMFENKQTLHGFLKNVSENCKLNGYFIGTCFDGLSIFNMLNSKSLDETYSIYKNENKIWQITKKYSYKNFDDNETSIGYAIDIYQESINKTFREYLVNFEYLTRIMESYGFIIAPKDDLININLNKGIGSFADLFKILEQKVKSKTEKQNYYGNAVNMSPEEKTISFLNKYFIYKKFKNIDINDIANILDKKNKDIQYEVKELQETIQETQEQIKREKTATTRSKTKPKSIKLKIIPSK